MPLGLTLGSSAILVARIPYALVRFGNSGRLSQKRRASFLATVWVGPSSVSVRRLGEMARPNPLYSGGAVNLTIEKSKLTLARAATFWLFPETRPKLKLPAMTIGFSHQAGGNTRLQQMADFDGWGAALCNRLCLGDLRGVTGIRLQRHEDVAWLSSRHTAGPTCQLVKTVLGNYSRVPKPYIGSGHNYSASADIESGVYPRPQTKRVDGLKIFNPDSLSLVSITASTQA